MRHQEIRTHFKTMSQAERHKTLEAARTVEDEDTLMALASHQSYLSGLSPEMHRYARDVLVEAHAPKEAAALKGITEQQQFVGQFRDHMLQSVADLVDFKKADDQCSLNRGLGPDCLHNPRAH